MRAMNRTSFPDLLKQLPTVRYFHDKLLDSCVQIEPFLKSGRYVLAVVVRPSMGSVLISSVLFPWVTSESPVSHQWVNSESTVSHQWVTSESTVSHQWVNSESTVSQQWVNNGLPEGYLHFRTVLVFRDTCSDKPAQYNLRTIVGTEVLSQY